MTATIAEVDLTVTGTAQDLTLVDLDSLSEMQLLDLYLRVRTLLATRLGRSDGAESIEMLFARMAEVIEPAPVVPTSRRLSSREREVLHFIAQDRTNADIATTLFISENTVKNHVANICRKYEVKNRHAAVRAALRDGTLTVD